VAEPDDFKLIREIVAEGGRRTAFVYVNTSKQVGDKDHIKVFATVDAAEKWFEDNDARRRGV
jgi:hypothetical protein